jgi:glycosyltransferase involved in cell wall biosynthesis
MSSVRNLDCKTLRNLVILSPAFNEEDSISEFLIRADEVLRSIEGRDWTTQLILINDGSTDRTLEVINKARNTLQSPITVLNLAVNSGHQNALWAGLERVQPNAFVIAMDCDLQDPPELIPEIVKRFEQNHDVVLTRRISRKDNLMKRITASIFYRVLSWITPSSLSVDSGDFFGLSPESRLSLLEHKESVKYIRGLIQTVSANITIIPFHRGAREYGETKYSYSKMIKLAISGITSFSVKPLIWSAYLSLIGTGIGIASGVYLLAARLNSENRFPPGYVFASLVIMLLILFLLFVMAVVSIYLSMLVVEIKNRPIYFLDKDSRKVGGTRID